tara:strand:- start:457 stop:2544 length:2088 start_codon:yes stop_codon:yes gene_type:complete
MNYHFTRDSAIQELKKSLKEENFLHALKLCNGILKFEPSNKFAKKNKKRIEKNLNTHNQIQNNPLKSLEIKFNEGHFNDVIKGCEKLINEGRNSSELYNLYGSALKEIRNFEKALNAFDKSIGQNSNNFAPFLNKGIIFYDLKDYQKAEKNLQHSININSEIFISNFALALVIHDSVKHNNKDLRYDLLKRSVLFYEKALKLNESFLELYSNYGNALMSLGWQQKAKLIYLKGLNIDPKNANLLFNLGNLYEKECKYDEAIDCFTQAIKNNGKIYQAHNNLATLLVKHQKNYDLALYHYNEAISINKDPDYLSNKASLLEEMGQIDKAYTTINAALKIEPNNSKAYYNKGKVLDRMGLIDEAIIAYDKSIHLNPNFVDAKWNKSISHLLLKDFSTGWKNYEIRRRRSSWIKQIFNGKELTNTNQLSGKSILLYSEQGLGDTIQFIRFAQNLLGIASKVFVLVQKPLKNILHNMQNVEIISKIDGSIKTDYNLPLMSLPKLLNISLDNILPPIDLKLCEASIKNWKNKINEKKINIGVAWLGSKTHEDDKQILKYRRSFSPHYFEHFNNIPDIHFYSLQKESDIIEDHIKNIPDNIQRFEGFDNKDYAFKDTISLIKNLDLVISCDTSVAHIAGSLKCPVWVPLKYIPDWRWMLNTSKTPYYPTMKLYRQNEWGNWDFVFENMKKDLQNFKKLKKG